MLSSLTQTLIKCSKNARLSSDFIKESRHFQSIRHYYDPRAKRWSKSKIKADSDTTALAESKTRELIQSEFSEYYSEGKFINRISYVDFIDEALVRLKELGLERDIESYKELLRVFPPGKYCHKSNWDIGLFHAPQQLCAIRLLSQMEFNMVKTDKDIEKLVVEAFGKKSAVWLKMARMNFWSMKGRNVDPNPIPELLPQQTYELAKIAMVRMLDDKRSIISVRRTASVPDAIDKTWVISSQNPGQQGLIERLNEKSILYLEETGLTYVNDKYLSYFTLKVYDDEETTKRRNKKPEPDFNYNTVKMKFFGKPIREKLESMNDVHHVDNYRVLAIGMTGTSSHDSVLSWLKILQERNPRLKQLNVVFRLKRPTMDLMDPKNESEGQQQQQEQSASN